MKNKLLHTPEGVRDIYNGECERKLCLQNDLHRVLKSYGCRDIETPTFEFFDVFGSEVGTTPSRELYKFFDREGNTLVLRPDITPSIARAVSKYFAEEEKNIRLCYVGNTFINNPGYQGRLKERTHLGAELIGSNDAQTDAETIAMVVDCLKAAGLEEFQISIGQVDYFKSIVSSLKIEEDIAEELKDYISNRNLFGVETIVSNIPMDEQSRRALLELPSLYGSVEVLKRAADLACSEEASLAVRRLWDVWHLLEYYDVTRYISFDLGMLGSYNYYTGIFFRGYTFGSGDAVVKGGRYDHLLKHFGKDAPSIGFVVEIDRLMAALSRQKIPAGELPEILTLYYTEELQKQAITLAKKLRLEGKMVALQFVTHQQLVSEPELLKQTEMLRELCKKYNITAGEVQP
ncbi:MAG: ATP phosphoribosyltransferase regulatory subunit [Eubacteriales bacterium]|nr:ATP phosphoribosyltransferase regulatory subunit [Eubacteriales bacterium]